MKSVALTEGKEAYFYDLNRQFGIKRNSSPKIRCAAELAAGSLGRCHPQCAKEQLRHCLQRAARVWAQLWSLQEHRAPTLAGLVTIAISG